MVIIFLAGLIILIEFLLFKLDSRELNSEEEFEIMKLLISKKMDEIFKR